MEGGRNGWNQEIAESTGEATYEKVIFFCKYIYHLNFFSGFLNSLNCFIDSPWLGNELTGILELVLIMVVVNLCWFFSFFIILGIYYFTLFRGEKVGDISAMSKSGNLNLWKFWAILVSHRVPTHLKTQNSKLPHTWNILEFLFSPQKFVMFFLHFSWKGFVFSPNLFSKCLLFLRISQKHKMIFQVLLTHQC